LNCIKLQSSAFRRFHIHSVALIPPHFVTATVTVRTTTVRQRFAAEGVDFAYPTQLEYHADYERRLPPAST
ncbi:MAG: hypothetical protein KAJ13_12640, partial [Gemmatimonadetes bacterium]|nr:hypothetical protein [Gemmatimonadota bacterium]